MEVALHVLDDDDRIVNDESDGKDDRQKSEEIDRESADLHQEGGSDERDRDGDHGDEHRTRGSQEEEDHDDHDAEGLGKRLEYLADGFPDKVGRVVGNLHRHARRKEAAEFRELVAHALADVEGVCRRQAPDADELRGLPVEADVGVVILRTQFHVGDVLETDQHAVAFLDHELPELLGGFQVRVGDQVDGGHGPLGLANRREVVVGLKGLADL